MMHIISMSCRRGTSTIYGVMIFVGIMFTAVIPMLLVMRQADTFYETEKFSVGRIDEEHSREDIDFLAYTLEDGSNEIYVKIENKGDAPIKIVRIWINEVEYPQNENFKSMETRVLGSFIVELPPSQASYTVKVITEKGNVFSSEAGTLYYSDGGWYTPSLGICVHIENFRGKYQIVLKIDAVEFYRYESPSMEHGEVEDTIFVDGPGWYSLTIKKDYEGGWIHLNPEFNEYPVEVLWPSDKPITDVYASGL